MTLTVRGQAMPTLSPSVTLQAITIRALFVIKRATSVLGSLTVGTIEAHAADRCGNEIRVCLHPEGQTLFAFAAHDQRDWTHRSCVSVQPNVPITCAKGTVIRPAGERSIFRNRYPSIIANLFAANKHPSVET